ncbi:hypothetical protein DBR43_17370 [Pedobacter sp. KBW06]|uniref:hypothetical protein n=1 Tax=Pedobacter sp. KBW06 TaxID=2153359 RepID=UPI000F5B5DD3|nr:hypothetical protein [Pedobacter sp. KBW06]RQO69827.1 hypothetical protein DBR43_17370 [Pedobacter sp. KBW06]
MNSREIFLAACSKISEELADFGFKASQQCQSLKKKSADKDITFEIYFQSSSLNSPGFVKLLPHLLISSKRLKKWLMEQNNGEYENAMIYGEQLGYITHFQEWKSWNVSGNIQETAVAEVIETIKTYALPIFDLFENTQKAIPFLAANGTKFNPYANKHLSPLAFMLCLGKKEEAQAFFLNYLADTGGKSAILKLYKELEGGKPINLMFSEFSDAVSVKLAYLNGLKTSK